MKFTTECDIEVDVKVKCIESETTQAQRAEDIGTTERKAFYGRYNLYITR